MAARFEELVVWQRARALTSAVRRLSHAGTWGGDIRFASQIQAASVSVMANISGGHESQTKAGFHRHVCIAKAFCGELRSHLNVALDVGYIAPDVFESLKAAAEEICKMLSSPSASLRR